MCDRLLKNFYRHPGTDLYQRMVVGHDSYMHLCYRIDKKAETIEDGKEAASE